MNEGSENSALNSYEKEREFISEAHEDMVEYNATKKTVTELLQYKRALIDLDAGDFDKINEVKIKALEAINHLFNDIIASGKN